MKQRIIIIGSGVAGLTTAGVLAENGFEVVVLEKESRIGGHVRKWDRLFPNRRPANEVMEFIEKVLNSSVDLRCGVTVNGVIRHDEEFIVLLSNNETVTGHALVLATGFQLFDAHKKEEYGYGIYDNVITSAELETIFKEGKQLTTNEGKTPHRVGIIHCVGSRDEKVGNLYCSKVCCVTGVKQAIEIREQLPECEVFSFYMDLRMYDRHFEELYYEAQQQWAVNFIRGRLSECSENPDHTLILKAEDTLTGRPLKMTVDIVILLVGIIPDPETGKIASMLGLPIGTDGFLMSGDEHIKDNTTTIPGIYLTGAVKGPASIVNTIADARATAQQITSRFMAG
ncbi:MAG: FAD-dependent oxidoreductase [Bacteroidales bacterium]|jgi:heterodisulfide reductase subunit A|nr:FAD-dependent oxidoreductase [Bacteroidales bacterium]